MSSETRQFIREARHDIRLLMAQCSNCDSWQSEAETEMLARATAGGSANLAFFIPLFWKNRRAA